MKSPRRCSRVEHEGGGGPLRSNIGNEMGVGGYVGVGLAQDLGLLPSYVNRAAPPPESDAAAVQSEMKAIL